MAKKKEPKRIGRPPIEINPVQLEALGAIQATEAEAAAVLGCTRRTLIKRLADPELMLAYENGKLKGRLNLRRLQWRHANGPTSSAAVNMVIHMSKQEYWLGENDKTPFVSNNIQTNNTLALTNASESDLRALESILARIADASAGQGRIIEAGDSSTAPAG